MDYMNKKIIVSGADTLKSVNYCLPYCVARQYFCRSFVCNEVIDSHGNGLCRSSGVNRPA